MFPSVATARRQQLIVLPRPEPPPCYIDHRTAWSRTPARSASVARSETSYMSRADGQGNDDALSADGPGCGGLPILHCRERLRKATYVRLGIAYQPIRRIRRQNEAQALHDAPMGFSTRVHVIGVGNVWDSSESANQAMPGRTGEVQTHPPSSFRRGPNAR